MAAYDRTRVRIGTEAHHKLGDISRDDPDYFWVEGEDADNYYGRWLTGFGFIGVRFPKHTTRAVTDDEYEWLEAHPLVIT